MTFRFLALFAFLLLPAAARADGLSGGGFTCNGCTLSTATLSGGTLSGTTTLPGSGNSIDASGNASFGNVNVTSSTAPTNGMYLGSAGTPSFAASGARSFFYNSQSILSNTGTGFELTTGASSATVPSIIPNRSAATTGLGGDGTSLFGIIAGSAVVAWGAGGQTINGSGQLNIAAMTQTAVAQSGTVCYNSGTGAVNYDATLGCLTSLEEQKNIARPITGALGEVMKIKPFWFTWKNKPEDPAEQPGMGAHQVESVDKRLAAYGSDGALRGVRYQEMTAVLVAAMQEQQAEIESLKKALRKRRH
jgi:hypothetical protein